MEPVRRQAGQAVARGAETDQSAQGPDRPVRPARPVWSPPAGRPAVPTRGAQTATARHRERVREGARALEGGRYRDAERILKRLVAREPDDAEVRELYGVALYRLGRWALAIQELEAHRRLSGSVEQLATLADCHRALRHWDTVDELWEELGQASPGAALVAEGRIVAAGSRADRGDLPGAIRLLERAPAPGKPPREHHLRVWYALGDLRERAGDVPGARELFARIVRHDAQFADASERLAALGT